MWVAGNSAHAHRRTSALTAVEMAANPTASHKIRSIPVLRQTAPVDTMGRHDCEHLFLPKTGFIGETGQRGFFAAERANFHGGRETQHST